MDSEPKDAPTIQELLDQCNRLVNRGSIEREPSIQLNRASLADLLTQCDQLIDQRLLLQDGDEPDLLAQCDKLVDQECVRATRLSFMTTAVESYEQATVLLGYFSQLLDFKDELAQLSEKLIAHRSSILEAYADILPPETIKSLTMPSPQTQLYQKGIHKFHRVKNYMLYHYRQKLYFELELEPKRIGRIREIVSAVCNLDKHYDIYHELIVDLQKKHKDFDQLMYKHLPEFVHF